jgi:hypothetical protein
MLIHPMAERLRDIGFSVMADPLLDLRNQSAADDPSHEDWLARWPRLTALTRDACGKDKVSSGKWTLATLLRQQATHERAHISCAT